MFCIYIYLYLHRFALDLYTIIYIYHSVKIEAITFPETSASIYHTTWLHFPEANAVYKPQPLRS